MTATYRAPRTDHRPRLCVDCGRRLVDGVTVARGPQCPKCQRHTLAMIARVVDRATVGGSW